MCFSPTICWKQIGMEKFLRKSVFSNFNTDKLSDVMLFIWYYSYSTIHRDLNWGTVYLIVTLNTNAICYKNKVVNRIFFFFFNNYTHCKMLIYALEFKLPGALGFNFLGWDGGAFSKGRLLSFQLKIIQSPPCVCCLGVVKRIFRAYILTFQIQHSLLYFCSSRNFVAYFPSRH